MLAEYHIVLDSDDVVGIIWVILLQMHQYLELNARLVLEALLVSDELDSNHLLSLVVKALEGLSEGALA